MRLRNFFIVLSVLKMMRIDLERFVSRESEIDRTDPNTPDISYQYDDPLARLTAHSDHVPFKLRICSACQRLTEIRKKRLEDANDNIVGRNGKLDEPQTAGCDRLPACGERDTQRTI